MSWQFGLQPRGAPRGTSPRSEGAGISKEALAGAIRGHVKRKSEAGGGFFLVHDHKNEQDLKLRLIKVHDDKLAQVGENMYFACADFKTPEGKIYDIDIFMKGTSADSLSLTQIAVHKEEGKERYTWHLKEGIWTKKEMGTAPVEHPEEHPQKQAQKESEEHPAEHPK